MPDGDAKRTYGKWAAYGMMRAVHIVPLQDWVMHEPDDCVCGPDVHYIDPVTGLSYPRPLISHHALDGRT